jgi:hypothetical protein
MKKYLVMALALTLTAVSVSFASEPESATASPESAKAKQQLSAPKQKKSKKEALTGSYIKYKIRRDGIITDGPNNVFVLDSKTIQNSGAADLSQLLFRTGFRR